MSQQISSVEVKKHSSESSAWMVIHSDVYDVTKFLEEHPGGADSLLEYAGKDGSQAFEDVGHSDDAREIMKKYKIGTLPPNESPPPPTYGFVPHQNKEVIVYPASRSSSPIKSKDPDDRGLRLATSEPKIIVVPRERTSGRKSKSSGASSSSSSNGGSKLKWVAISVASLLVIGFAARKYINNTSLKN